MSFSAPRMYLANGVTTARTPGSVDPYTDLRLKETIEKGMLPGPHFDVTGPYLEGAGNNSNLQMRQLTGPEDATETVAYWADRGVTSFKAYAHITREELRAAVAEAHKHGLKVTGHLCSVTYAEAAEIGIDNIEHGFRGNTGMDPDKKPDACSDSAGDYTLGTHNSRQSRGEAIVRNAISHHVAITSTMTGAAAGLPLKRQRIRGRCCGQRCWKPWLHQRVIRIYTAGIAPDPLRVTRHNCNVETWTCNMPSSQQAVYCWQGQTRWESAEMFRASGISVRLKC
jgi:hypothetical protein